MLKKILFPIVVITETVLIFFLSGPILAASAKSHTLIFCRLQICFVIVFMLAVGTFNMKYKKAIAGILLLVYLVYIILWGRFLHVHWWETIKDQNSF